MSGLSIGYQVMPGGASDGGKGRRLLTSLKLHEVSIVTDPANTLARIASVKNALGDGSMPTIREFEGFLREVGFSASQATAIASRGYKAALHRDDADTAGVAELISSLRGFSLSSK